MQNEKNRECKRDGGKQNPSKDDSKLWTRHSSASVSFNVRHKGPAEGRSP